MGGPLAHGTVLCTMSSLLNIFVLPSTVQQSPCGAAVPCSPPTHPADHVQRRALRPGIPFRSSPPGWQQQTR